VHLQLNLVAAKQFVQQRLVVYMQLHLLFARCGDLRVERAFSSLMFVLLVLQTLQLLVLFLPTSHILSMLCCQFGVNSSQTRLERICGGQQHCGTRTGAQRGDTLTFLLIFIKFTMANIFSFGITLRIERI
jgi:hypothetical protein